MKTAATTVYVVLALLFSPLFVLSLLLIRNRVRDHRRRLIRELEILFFKNKVSSPAFDYVRAKYGMGDVSREAGREPGWLSLCIAAGPYTVLSMIGFVLLFVPTVALTCTKATLEPCAGLPLLTENLFWTMGVPSNLATAGAICAAALLGGYLMTCQVLLRAVQNYELNELTFLRCAMHLAFGLITAMVGFHVVAGASKAVAPLGHPLLIGMAFLVGYMPDLGLINITRKLRVQLLKSVDEQAMAAVRIQPLELLDGIDYGTRYRLDQAGYYDIQNLAVANPLLLYIETPYTFYQVFDWVLQAQLCLAAGTRAFLDLRRLHIRTSLDLERAVLARHTPDTLVLAVGAILCPPSLRDGTPSLDLASVLQMVRGMLDDLHVHRLRWLWALIFQEVSAPGGKNWLYGVEEDVATPGCGCAAAGAQPPGDPQTASIVTPRTVTPTPPADTSSSSTSMKDHRDDDIASGI